MNSMKLINYRGGIARFHLPASWIEEYEESGGATFYEDKPGSGTLRINVLEVEKPSEGAPTSKTAYDLISEISEKNLVRPLPEGAAIAHSTERTSEGDKELLLHTWHVGTGVTAVHFRIIIFTYTILAAQESDPKVRDEIAMLDESISQGEYSAMRGIAGNYKQS